MGSELFEAAIMNVDGEDTQYVDLISEFRLNPASCLYCDSKTFSREHILTEAVGGRLVAPILCVEHNNLINTLIDDRFNKSLAPIVNMLRVPRQRRPFGAEFVATDDSGEAVVIKPEGFAKRRPLDVKKRDEYGKILYAEGDLNHLDLLKASALSNKVDNRVLAKITNTQANFNVVIDDVVALGALKTAFHFFAGFLGEIPRQVALEMLRIFESGQEITGSFVRTPYLHLDVFGASWPPRHEITAYRDDSATLITVLLFGTYGFTCRLPLLLPDGKDGTRYKQMLTSSDHKPRLTAGYARPKQLDWDDRPSKYDYEFFFAPIKERQRKIYEYSLEQAVQVRAERAFGKALEVSRNFGSLSERYAAELQLECFTANEVDRLVMLGMKLHDEGKKPWLVPVRVSEASE